MPKSTLLGLIIAGSAFLFGFGVVWHMWWLAVVGITAIVVLLVARSFEDEIEYTIKKQ